MESSAFSSASDLTALPAPSAVLLTVRRSLQSMLFPISLLTVCALFIVSLTVVRHSYPDSIPYHYFLALPLLLALELLRRYLNCSYNFEERTLTGFLGHLSLNYRIPRVRYCDIVEIKVCQTLLGRILGYGDVSVYTVARYCPLVRFVGVKKPLDLAIFLDEMSEVDPNVWTVFSLG